PPERRPAEGAPRERSGPAPRKQAPPARPRRGPGRGPKIALSVVSLLVLSATGYGWAAMQGLVDGLTFADVIESKDTGELPADGARDILLVGMDSRTDAQGNPLPEDMLAKLDAGVADGELNTDTLIFVHIPNDGSKAVALSLPRDSYVDIPGGYGKHKINSAYARGKLDAKEELQAEGVSDAKELEVRSNQAGAKTLIKTVEGLTGSTIDNYASINLLGFYEITQAIGGVDVCLKQATNDPYSGARFEKGPTTVEGIEALSFVRQRHGLPRNDLDRVVRQQVFMAGLARKILSAGTLADPDKLSDLTEAIKKSVVLNKGWDILGFAQRMKGLTGGQIEFRTIPVANVAYETPSDGTAVQVDPREVRTFVRNLAGGEDKQDQPDSGVPNSAVTVDVFNGAGTTSLAAGVSQTLSGQGFTAGQTGNAEARQGTVVRVPEGEQAMGDQVAGALDDSGGPIEVQEDPSIAAGHATILLGTDYPDSAAAGGSRQNSAQSGTGQTPPASGQQEESSAAEQAEEEAPITADGVICVN
ncbi:LCP family protein, partial [Amycolatopsis cihanbeyliensis]